LNTESNHAQGSVQEKTPIPAAFSAPPCGNDGISGVHGSASYLMREEMKKELGLAEEKTA
jgi:hypothetical protein